MQGPVLHWAGLTVAELGQAGWRALGRLAAGACGAPKLAQAHLKVKHYFGRRPSRTARLTAPQDPEGTGVGKEREAHIQHGQAGPRRAPSWQGHTGRQGSGAVGVQASVWGWLQGGQRSAPTAGLRPGLAFRGSRWGGVGISLPS